MTTILPRKKQKILNFLKNFVREHGYAPTLKEIAEEFSLSSPATVHEHLQYLEQKGFLSRKGRNSLIINENINKNSPSAKDEIKPRQEKAIMVPVVGIITAGLPIEAIEDKDLELPVPREIVNNKNSFILKVKGDSMIESLITDGDFVICEKTDYAKDGDTVVALLEDGSATLKKFFKTKNLIRLQPANKKYKPLYTKNVIIQGKVVGIIRKL